MFRFVFLKIKAKLLDYIKSKFTIHRVSNNKNVDFEKELPPWRSKFLNDVIKKIGSETKTILEIGDGDGLLSYKLSKQFIDRNFYGIDIGRCHYKINNYQHLKMSATELLFPEKCFDLIISHNVFEHINGLELAITEALRVLKPNGRLYAYFAPVWTSAYGHHFYNDTGKEVTSVFPPFCHLYLNDEALLRLIKEKVGYFSPERIRAEDYLIGGCNNKLLPDDYREIFRNRKDFTVTKFNEITNHHHNHNDNRFTSIQLCDKYLTLTKEDLRVVGFEIEGVKL